MLDSNGAISPWIPQNVLSYFGFSESYFLVEKKKKRKKKALQARAFQEFFTHSEKDAQGTELQRTE